MAEKYQNYIMKFLTQRKELIDSTKEHRIADLVLVTTEQILSRTLQLNSEKVLDCQEIIERDTKLAQQTNKDEICENAKSKKTQLRSAEEISLVARDSDPQVLQKLKQEIEKVKHQLSQKDKIIEEETKKTTKRNCTKKIKFQHHNLEAE